MRILRLYTPSGDPDRIRCLLDTGEELKLDGELVVSQGLRVGLELDEDGLAALKDAAAARAARKTALRMVGARAMSRREVTDRLTRRGAAAEDAENAADWLERIGAVDDREYAGMIARHYTARGYGPNRVKQELFRRGLQRDLWEDALAQLPPQEDSIRQLAESRLTPGAGREALRKLQEQLLRRGFENERIRAVLDGYAESGEY